MSGLLCVICKMDADYVVDGMSVCREHGDKLLKDYRWVEDDDDEQKS